MAVIFTLSIKMKYLILCIHLVWYLRNWRIMPFRRGFCPLILLMTILFQSSCWRVSNKQKYNPEEDRNLPQDLLSKNGHQRYHTSIRLQNKQRGKYWFYPQNIGRPGFKFHVPSRILLYQIKIDNLFYNIILGKTFISLGMKRNSELLTVLYSLPEDMSKMLRNGR